MSAAPGPALALVVLMHDNADWLEVMLAAAAAALGPGDEVALLDLGSGDGSAGLAQRFLDRQGFGPGIAARLIPLAEVPRGAAVALAIETTTAGYLMRIGGSDRLIVEGVAALRPRLAAGPCAVRAPERRWWLEPGLVLPPSPLSEPVSGIGSVVLRRDLAADPERGWPEDTSQAGAWRFHRRLAAEGAPVLDTPLVRVPHRPVSWPVNWPVNWPGSTDPELLAALLGEALADPCLEPGPGADTLQSVHRLLGLLPRRERRALFADTGAGPLFRALYRGGARAREAWAAARQTTTERLIGALAERTVTLRAERDALRPDADLLVRSYARLVAETDAGRALG